MKAITALIVALGVCSWDAANAACEYGCNGHGACGKYDQCTCFPGWVGPSCELRECPFANSWADSARGDLNHDGIANSINQNVLLDSSSRKVNELWQGSTAGEAHYPAECADRGICKRGTGECECLPGFEGSACQRRQCPGRCSGHGQCRTLREIAANAMTKTRVKSENGIQIHEGVVEKFDYDLWDADMNQACVCDPGFAGNDCSERLCPRGDDPLTNSREFCGERPCHNSVQQFDLTSNGENKLRFEFADWKGRSQAISVSVNTANDDPGLVAEADAATKLAGSLSTAGKVMYAIRSAFPEDYLAQVEVRAAGTVAGAGTFTADTASPGATNRYFITFTGAPGRQDLIKLVGESAVANSVAYVEAVETASGYATATAGATNTFPLHGNNEELPCSGRGACNKLSGLCECFAGYYGAACDYQNVLVM